jgi:hypothetical protein
MKISLRTICKQYRTLYSRTKGLHQVAGIDTETTFEAVLYYRRKRVRAVCRHKFGRGYIRGGVIS